MKTVAIIPNSRAGRGLASAHSIEAPEVLEGMRLELLFPRSPEEMQQACAQLDAQRYEAAVVLGGDGTCNQAIRGLRSSGVPLYPFPAGTANDLHSEHHIRPDWEQARRLLREGHVVSSPLIEANGIPFATVGGMGMGSDVVANYNALRARSRLHQRVVPALGSNVYTWLVLRLCFSWRPLHHRLRVRAEGLDKSLDVSGLFVCNQRTLGGRLHLDTAPDRPGDGFLVVIVPGVHRLRTPLQLAALRFPTLGDNFLRFRTRELSIESLDGQPLPVFGDGETLLSSSTVTFRHVPAGFRVYRDPAPAAARAA